jgi:hypothetical protein
MLSALTTKDRFVSLLFFFRKQNKIYYSLSEIFSIEWYYYSKIWFYSKRDFPRSQSLKRTTFLQLAVIFFLFFSFSLSLSLSLLLISDCFDVRNVIHGSDGPESAAREIKLWFKDEEIFSWDPLLHTAIYE